MIKQCNRNFAICFTLVTVTAANGKPMITSRGSAFLARHSLTTKEASLIAKELESASLKTALLKIGKFQSGSLQSIIVDASVSVQDGAGSYQISIEMDSRDGRVLDTIGDVFRAYCEARVEGASAKVALDTVRREFEASGRGHARSGGVRRRMIK